MEGEKPVETRKLPEKVRQVWAVIREKAISKPQNLHEKLQFLKDPDNVDVTFDETGEGLMNYIFRLVQKNGDSKQRAIVKNTCDQPANIDMGNTPAGKMLDENDEEFKMTPVRMLAETRCLRKFNEIVPGIAPQVYVVDMDDSYFIMEDLFKYKVLGKALSEPGLQNKELVEIVTSVATAIAAIHRGTHRKTLSPDQFQLIHTEIGNFTKEIMDKYPVWMKMLMTDPNCQMLRKDMTEAVRKQLDLTYKNEEFQRNVLETIDTSVSKKDCLIHNDFHMGGVMVNGTDVKFIDPEGASVGPPESDVGCHAADIISFFYIHKGNNPEIARNFVLALKTFLDVYLKKMDDFIANDIPSFFENVAGVTAARTLLRIMVPASVPGLDKVPEQEAENFRCGVNMLDKMKSIHSMDTFLSVAFNG